MSKYFGKQYAHYSKTRSNAAKLTAYSMDWTTVGGVGYPDPSQIFTIVGLGI